MHFKSMFFEQLFSIMYLIFFMPSPNPFTKCCHSNTRIKRLKLGWNKYLRAFSLNMLFPFAQSTKLRRPFYPRWPLSPGFSVLNFSSQQCTISFQKTLDTAVVHPCNNISTNIQVVRNPSEIGFVDTINMIYC